MTKRQEVYAFFKDALDWGWQNDIFEVCSAIQKAIPIDPRARELSEDDPHYQRCLDAIHRAEFEEFRSDLIFLLASHGRGSHSMEPIIEYLTDRFTPLFERAHYSVDRTYRMMASRPDFISTFEKL